MSKRKFLWLGRVEWIIVIMITLGFATTCVFFINVVLSPLPDLSRAPEESRRVYHPAGFSIICPRQFRSIVSTAAREQIDQISLRPDGGSSRYHDAVSVTRLDDRDPPRVPVGWKRVADSFQNQPATVAVHAGDKYTTWMAEFSRGGHRFHLTMMVPDRDRDLSTMPPELWKPYLETFRVEPPPATRPD